MKPGNHCNRTLSRRQVLALLAAFGVGAEALAQDPARTNPRSYKVLFENDRVRVLEYQSRPGRGICGRGKHSHPAHLNVLLTDAKAKVTLPDGKSFFGQNKAGDVFWEPAVTHTVENVGGTDMRAYMVELKDKDWQPSSG
jgi:quercetin dioxygenase-like cupin family protein